LKIGVYSIARNEVKEVAGWLQATADADVRLVLDTGSTDGTDVALQRGGGGSVIVHHATIQPWRYDDARNAALALLPGDLDACIALDMDERLSPGWRTALEEAWTPNTKLLRCRLRDGLKNYYAMRIHTRTNWRWRTPVHEVLQYRGEGYVETLTDTFTIEHYPDTSKPRPVYIPLLNEGVAEAPNDPRLALILGWQLCLDGETTDGLHHLNRYLSLSQGVDREELAFVHRLLARYDAPDHVIDHLQRAEAAYQSSSNLVALADHYRATGQWAGCYTFCVTAIARERQNPVTVRYYGDDVDRLEGPWLHDTASEAAWNVWDFEAAFAHAVEAHRISPDDQHRDTMERIRRHLASVIAKERGGT
jgi:hypothetical protein